MTTDPATDTAPRALVEILRRVPTVDELARWSRMNDPARRALARIYARYHETYTDTATDTTEGGMS